MDTFKISARLLIPLTFTLAFAVSAPMAQAPDSIIDVCIPVEAMVPELAEVESGVLRAGLAMVDTAALHTARPTRLRFDLFDDLGFTGVVESIPTEGDDLIVLSGSLEGVRGGSFSLSACGESAVANLNVPDRGMFQIRPMGEGLHRVTQIDPEQLPPCAGTPVPPATHDMRETSLGVEPTDDGSVFDVLICYTPQARQAAGGYDGIEALIYLAVAETNTAYSASQINSRLRLAGMMEVDYVESNDFSTELSRLRIASDGYLDEVHAERDRVGADLVTLIVNATSSCGIGYLMQNFSNTFAPWAFNVVSRTCATGYYSFGHELGHNMGCAHDRDNASAAGATTHSYGHRWYGNSGSLFRSVMAYSPGTRIQRFSNPNVLYDGVATGIAADQADSADNASSINQAAPVVANWRSSLSPSVTISDVELNEGDGGSQIARFWVMLNPSATDQVTIDYEAVSETATAGVDFTSTSGTLTFAPGQVVKRIDVPVMGDTEPEEDETFSIILSGLVGAAVGDSQGSALIHENDRLEHLILPYLLGERSVNASEEDIADRNDDSSIDAADAVTEILN